MYQIEIQSGSSKTVSEEKSYAAATAAVRDAAARHAITLTSPVKAKLYRSPKVAAQVNEARMAVARRLLNLSFPRRAGALSFHVGDSFRVNITTKTKPA